MKQRHPFATGLSRRRRCEHVVEGAPLCAPYVVVQILRRVFAAHAARPRVHGLANADTFCGRRLLEAQPRHVTAGDRMTLATAGGECARGGRCGGQSEQRGVASPALQWCRVTTIRTPSDGIAEADRRLGAGRRELPAPACIHEHSPRGSTLQPAGVAAAPCRQACETLGELANPGPRSCN